MKQHYTRRIYKTDKRRKTGERIVFSFVLEGRDEEGMKRECAALSNLYPAKQGYRFEYNPTYKTVKNLMTGEDVVIPADTPWCCDPSSETYWSS